MTTTTEVPLPSSAASMEKLKQFRLSRVLSEDPVTKFIALLGTMQGQEGNAILVLERQVVARDTIEEMLCSVNQLNELITNDVYHLYRAYFDSSFSPVRVNLTFPATAKDIAKMEVQHHVRVVETPSMYSEVSRKYILEQPLSHVQWVYNILEKKCESERIISEDSDPDTGYLLFPDMKWDEKDASMMYCLAICNRRDLRSLRDLTAEHLPLLTNMLEGSYTALQQRFGVCNDRIRAFLHYHPTFYHLHVHFAHSNVCRHGVAVGRAHALEDVIDNLRLDSHYYQRRSLVCFLPERHELLPRLKPV